MTDASYKKLSSVLTRYVPEFIKSDYENFYAFLEAYCEWLGEENNPWYNVSNLLDFATIDTSIDTFAEYFRKTYIDNFPTAISADKALLIKHAKELYRSKGTQKSFKFLIKLLFNEDAEVYYPNRFIMKSSDGVWKNKEVIKTTNTSARIGELINTKIHGETSGATAVVENVEIFSNNSVVYALVYLSNIVGTFLTTERIIGVPPTDSEYIYETFYNCIDDITIEDGGNDYEVDDRINSTDGTDFVAKVSSIYTGKLDNIVITNGGSGYVIGDKINISTSDVDTYYSQPLVYVSNVDGSGTITGIQIKNKGYGYLKTPEVTSITSAGGTSAVLTCLSNDAGRIKTIDITNSGMSFTSPSLSVTSDFGGGALLTPSIGTVGVLPGDYKKDGSFLSDLFLIQDSDEYQDYSYVMKTTISLSEKSILSMNNYREIFKKIVHPAGFKLFSEFILRNSIDMSQYGLWNTITLGTGYDVNTIYLTNVIEMISYYDRIFDNRQLFHIRNDKITDIGDTLLSSYVKTGGDFINNTVELTT